MQALSYGRVSIVLATAIAQAFWLPQGALRVPFLSMAKLLLLLQEIPLPHFHLLLFEVLQVHMLLLLREFSPRSLLLQQGLRPRISSILLCYSLLLLALHRHLLHLLLHYQVLLLLLQ